ncbi:helix-turn-helix domain-containing protein [Robertkochia sediminum]|uniref:helix-turn-helix domain-containing protein n=1 Tax=Robertkochia sediminum TaxID=2785326 RepID=UPI001932618E|nr:helix-turn-helix domain-containing protein [Robertkochia sediminum]MBL7473087.1 helix-turn-helix domain-containing protein [Robertkochia sediminum]
MAKHHRIIEKLETIERMLEEQNLLKKEVLNFSEACLYIGCSQSHLYKLTSKKAIPHFCPRGKRLYFKRSELDLWLLRNPSFTSGDITNQADEYLTNKGKLKL